MVPRLSQKILCLLKYAILIIIMVLVLRFYDLKSKLYEEESSVLVEEDSSSSYLEEKLMLNILRDDFRICGKKKGVSSEFLRMFYRKMTPKINSRGANSRSPCSVEVLAKFNRILVSHGVKAAIIEPSILYGMLLPEYQELLVKRNFNLSWFSGYKDRITYGILHPDVLILKKEEAIKNFIDKGFDPQFIDMPLANWMENSPTYDSKSPYFSFTSHILYFHNYCIFHLVVFHNRRNYFWHGGLNEFSRAYGMSETSTDLKLLFVNYSGAYEKFSFLSLARKDMPLSCFYIPSNPHHFLFQMLSSRFLECDMTRAVNVTSSKDQSTRGRKMSVPLFNERTVIGIRQLKTVFHPLLMNLWIWSGTMLGWYRQCDIIPYTHDVDFAAWASEVDDMNSLINKLLRTKTVSIRMRMGILDEALEFQLICNNIHTDIFFIYNIQNGSWCSGHNPEKGYYIRYFYPPFTLCSADLLGEKVQVPCETLELIVPEYGPEWYKPVFMYNYQNSPRNRGPSIYWDKKVLKTAYQTY